MTVHWGRSKKREQNAMTIVECILLIFVFWLAMLPWAPEEPGEGVCANTMQPTTAGR